MLGQSSHARGKSVPMNEKKLPSIPPTEDSSQLQPLKEQQRYSTVSSLYSQPSPAMRQGPRLDIPRASSVYPDDISPPDSPRTTGGRSSSPNVSPISNAGSGGFKIKGPTKIPLPSQQQQQSGASYLSAWREKMGGNAYSSKDQKTKWDTYSGEPTQSEKGRPGSTVPKSNPFDRQQSMGTTSVVSSTPQPKESLFSSTLRKVKREAAPTQPREEWKGASGRHAIVPAPADKPAAKNKSFPTPKQRRKQGGLRQAGGLRQRETSIDETEMGVTTTITASIGNHASSPDYGSAARSTYTQPQEQNSRGSIVSPSPPRLEANLRTKPNEYEPSPLSQLHTQEATVNRSNILQEEPIVQSPAHVETPPRYDSPKITESQLRNAVQYMDLSDQPASRFSVTTYNTSIADSPPGTPDMSRDDIPPVPTPPASILNRKRPVPTAGVTFGSKPPSRKPTPSTAAQENSWKNSPVALADQEPVDRVTLLETKLASLEKRRINIETVIHELTNVVQPSSIAYDIASREEIKKTVEGLKAEGAVVAKEIHETGLKLHRALKKRDENSMYQPTGLWVRRVTE